MIPQSRTRAFALACILVALAFASAAETVTLRMAAYVPANSPWDIGLKRLASEFDRISGGTVRITFPQSVRVSNENDIIQKMKLGVDGALFTTYGIAEIYPDTMALSMPWLIHNDKELDAVLQAVEPLIRTKLEERYAVLVVSKGGWVRYFSKRPIVYPEDFDGLRMSVNVNDDKLMRLLQSVGARPVKGDMSGLLLQLNSNAVDAFYLSPVFVASLWSQYKGKISWMSPFRVSPFIGAIVFNRSSWDRIPEALRPKLEEAAHTLAAKMREESEKIEGEAIDALLKDGLRTWAYPADAEARWNTVYSQKGAGLVASMFSADMLDVINTALAKVRKSK